MIYEPGKESPCDYGSRHPPEFKEFTQKEKEDWAIESEEDIQVNCILQELIPSAIPMSVLQSETANDVVLQKVKEDIVNRKKCRKDLTSYVGVFRELSYVNGLVLRGSKIVVPEKLQGEVIGLAHEAHLGMDKTVALIRETMWFPKMHEKVCRYVESCRGCLAAISHTPPVPLQPNLLPEKPWQMLHADFKGPIGAKYYLHIIIDQYSKFPEVDVITSTKFQSLRPILDRIFSTHGIPDSLTTDNGSPYFSQELKNYSKEMGFKLDPVSPKDPQCNGFAENFVKSLCKLIHTCAAENKDPKKELSRFLLQYRATPHLTTGRSPAEMLYNRKIRTKLPSFDISKETKDRSRIRQQHNDKKMRQKRYFDKRRKATDKPVKVGDQIMIKQEKSTTKPPFNPDPFKVTSVVGNRITAANRDKRVVRDKNQVKVVHQRPDALKPSWERGEPIRATPHTTFRRDSLPLMPELSDDDSSDEADTHSNNIAVSEGQAQQELFGPTNGTLDQQNGQSPVRVNDEMTAHMERLFAQAERVLQETGPTEGRVTRSAGRSLQWNPEMNGDDVVLERS